MSLPDLNNRIVLAARKEGWVTEDEYNNTRPLTNSDNLAIILETESPKTPKLKGDEENSNFVSPKQLMKFIQDKSRATVSIYE